MILNVYVHNSKSNIFTLLTFISLLVSVLMKPFILCKCTWLPNETSIDGSAVSEYIQMFMPNSICCSEQGDQIPSRQILHKPTSRCKDATYVIKIPFTYKYIYILYRILIFKVYIFFLLASCHVSGSNST